MPKARHGKTVPDKSRTFGRWLSVLFVIALLMGAGPGTLLANSPRAIWGVPLLYFWCCVWFLVMAAIVVLAYLFVWKKEVSASD